MLRPIAHSLDGGETSQPTSGNREAARNERTNFNRQTAFPQLFTVDEVASLLRTTRRAIYAMIERGQLPGVIRIRRRVLLRADDLLHWLDQKRAPSPEE
jgi:excisionase family DNA binding protein